MRLQLILICIVLFSPCILSQNYPPSPVIASVDIADTDVVSIGFGDNFPMTWADNDTFYTMYCDGTGFSGSRDISNGLAQLIGTPPDIRGENISSPDIEFIGGGSQGRKTSGLVCINGSLYALVRNLFTDGTGTSLFWSDDKAETWEEAQWNWPEIGLADWLNMGKNYEENTDGYAYFIAHDGDNAYVIYDNLMMGRVLIDSIPYKEAYEYFAGWDNNEPQWTREFTQHRPVFTAPGKCYRMNLVYNPGIKRYLLVTLPWKSSGDYDRYLGIFDAPNPWGPWAIAAEKTDFTERRYHPRLPSKWISEDGLTLWYEFSVLSPRDRYRFNLRKMTLTLHPTGAYPLCDGNVMQSASSQCRIKDVYVNPATRTLTIHYSAPVIGTAVLYMYTIRGRVLARISPASSQTDGEIHWRLHVKSLPAGIYILRVENGGQIVSQRAIMVK